MKSPADLLAEYLLQIKAIRLNVQNPFTWASGWKSPVYCDNRILLSYPEIRSFVKHALKDIVIKYFSQANCVAGVATAGIPHGTLVADLLDLPFVYVRSQPKNHGMKNMIEGRLPEAAKVVVIEDVVSTGKSSLKAVEDLREAGAEITGMAAIYSYGFDEALEDFEKKSVRLMTISNYNSLLSVAIREGYIEQEALQTLHEWRQNPSIWRQ